MSLIETEAYKELLSSSEICRSYPADIIASHIHGLVGKLIKPAGVIEDVPICMLISIKIEHIEPENRIVIEYLLSDKVHKEWYYTLTDFVLDWDLASK